MAFALDQAIACVPSPTYCSDQSECAPGESAVAPRPITPPLKWAGGKRWLAQRLAGADLPSFTRLIEPFAGSAAAFFAMRPPKAILNDNNSELINVYQAIQLDHGEVYRILRTHAEAHCPSYYYDVRASIPAGRECRAARTLYLNRTCWNALYRVNRRGEFNVPIGTKTAVLLPNDDFSGVAAALNTATLLNDDFTSPLAVATEGDLIFADPPYFSSSKRGTFVKYTNPAFSWKDQERLAAAIDQARGRGANFILTNADTPELETLYGGRGYLSKLARHTVISGKAAGRSKTTELLWTSFPLQV